MSAPRATAALIADGGAAATGEDFFRSPEFLEAEGVTHTLRIDAAEATLLAPLIVRPIGEGPDRDAVSPYGYPGLVPAPQPQPQPEPPPPSPRVRVSSRPAQQNANSAEREGVDPAGIDFSGTGLVSVFVRHRLGPPPLRGASQRSIVQIADPALAPKSRPTDRRQIRRNLEAGYELELVPGSETSEDQRAGFLDLYEQTMRRTEAAGHYFFGAAYFDRVLQADRTWLALARAPGGALAAASIAAVSDGHLHYYLSGSADSHLRDSPMKNVLGGLLEHSAALGLPLNLGGGLSRGDALEAFKRGFANREAPWHASELICDPEKYKLLSAGRDPRGFFPAYRA